MHDRARSSQVIPNVRAGRGIALALIAGAALHAGLAAAAAPGTRGLHLVLGVLAAWGSLAAGAGSGFWSWLGRAAVGAGGIAALGLAPRMIDLPAPQFARLAAALSLVHALVLGFFLLYRSALAARAPRQDAMGMAPVPLPATTGAALARLFVLAEILAGGALLGAPLVPSVPLLPAVVGVAGAALGALLLEAAIRHALWFFQPARQRAHFEAARSPLVESLLAGGSPLSAWVQQLEGALGVDIRSSWVFPFLRRLAPRLALAVTLLTWLASAATVVPPGAQGVEWRFGAIVRPARPAGLQWSLPWPAGRIEVVETDRVREFALGYDQDLGVPVLWNEKHFEGEQNLLVGRGEELLTFNVPILWRVSDGVAWLASAADPAAAVQHLAARELARGSIHREAFALMVTERAAVADELRDRLQRAADALGLGVEILSVGLKDIHPSVTVAPAFQDVVSAVEDREELILQARRYAAEALPRAEQDAAAMRTAAAAAAQEQVALARGAAARFDLVRAAQAASPRVFRARRLFETMEEALRRPAKIVLPPAVRAAPELWLDLRERYGDASFVTPPAPGSLPAPPPAPVPFARPAN